MFGSQLSNVVNPEHKIAVKQPLRAVDRVSTEVPDLVHANRHPSVSDRSLLQVLRGRPVDHGKRCDAEQPSPP